MILPIGTPALLLDLDVVGSNLARMAKFFADGPTRLRPHYKNHKCPALARRQLAAGAIGMTCATLAEAEALTRNGIGNVLIGNEIAGEVKIQHFVELSRKGDVIVAVDNAKVVDQLAAAARAQQAVLQVVVDVDVGQARCGVQPGEPALGLARRVIQGGLRFRGLMGYEGHVGRLKPGPEKERAAHQAMDRLVKTRCLLEAQGIPVEIVIAGGTGTYCLSGRFPGVTEIQGGSYLVMDVEYRTVCPDFDVALSVLGTVISKTGRERIVVDVGLKSISSERGLPVLKGLEGARLRKLNAEHGIIDIIDPQVPVEVGDQIEIWPYYSDATINLHERMYGIRSGAIEEILRIEG